MKLTDISTCLSRLDAQTQERLINRFPYPEVGVG
jgi:hypothetical protein